MAGNVTVEVSKVLEEILPAFHAYLYDIEYIKEGKNQVLRVYIDNDEKGIFINDCEKVSRKLSEILDEKNLIQTAYHLEVSSPGVDRKLTKDWHFEKAINKKIELSTYAPVDGQKNFTGTLLDFRGKLLIDDNGKILEFEREKVSSAKLHFRF